METRPISPETEPRLKVGTCRLLLPHILITDFHIVLNNCTCTKVFQPFFLVALIETCNI